MSPVAAPADRRFRRSHVKPARRRRWYVTVLRPVAKYGAFLVIAGFLAQQTASAIGGARALQIDAVAVSGNARLSSTDVRAALDGMRGENIVTADLSGWRRQLLESPWVRDATLRRSLPSTIEVVVTERAPMAIARMGDGLYLLDGDGVVIDEYGPAHSDLDLPIVDGLSDERSEPGATTDRERASLAARVIGELAARPELFARLSQVHVGNPRNAAIILSGDSAVLHLGSERFLARTEAYLELQQKLRERVPRIDHVDLRFDGRVYVRPAGDGPSAEPASRQSATPAKARRSRGVKRR